MGFLSYSRTSFLFLVLQQVVVLGTGKSSLEAEVKTLKHRFPGVAVGVVKFSSPLAHLITAGADFMVVPSRFEPCGLIQMHAMAYGTVPLVSSTGGLVDTVKEGVTGFQMGAMDIDGLVPEDAEAVAATMMRAAEVFGTPAFNSMRHACIAQDLSWEAPARKWEALLARLSSGSPITYDSTPVAPSVPTPVARLENPEAFPPVPEPKPAAVAAAAVAPKLGPSAPTVAPAAAAAAATIKKQASSVNNPVNPIISRSAASAAAKASVNKAPAPTPAKASTSPAKVNGKADESKKVVSTTEKSQASDLKSSKPATDAVGSSKSVVKTASKTVASKK